MKEARATLHIKGYDLLLWLVKWAEKLPRSARRFHGDEILDATRAMVVAITAALTYTSGRDELLATADLALVRLKLGLRLAGDCGVLSDRHRRFLTPQVEELGRMLGGWQKYERAQRRKYHDIGRDLEGEGFPGQPG